MSSAPDNSIPLSEPAAATDESIQAVHAALLRHPSEPAEGYALLPLGLLGFMSTLILVCCTYFVYHRGGFDPLVQDGRYDPSANAGVEVPLTHDQIVAQGKKLFGQTCIQCHQATGLGAAGAYPPLAGSDIVQGSEERVIRIVLEGLHDPIKVNGAVFPTGNVMPPFSPGMPNGIYNWSDKKIAYVLTYVRQEWGNKAPEITEDKVKEIHDLTKDRKTGWTEAELPKQ